MTSFVSRVFDSPRSPRVAAYLLALAPLTIVIALVVGVLIGGAVSAAASENAPPNGGLLDAFGPIADGALATYRSNGVITSLARIAIAGSFVVLARVSRKSAPTGGFFKTLVALGAIVGALAVIEIALWFLFDFSTVLESESPHTLLQMLVWIFPILSTVMALITLHIFRDVEFTSSKWLSVFVLLSPALALFPELLLFQQLAWHLPAVIVGSVWLRHHPWQTRPNGSIRFADTKDGAELA